MIHAILGISGECGELLDAVKKHVIYGKPLDLENMREEMGDLHFYLAHLHTITGITEDDAKAANMAKLAKRYPGYEYTDEKAKERADKSDDGWIEWKGESDECPVIPDTRGEWKVRGRPNMIMTGILSELSWIHQGDSLDIIAYRIVK